MHGSINSAFFSSSLAGGARKWCSNTKTLVFFLSLKYSALFLLICMATKVSRGNGSLKEAQSRSAPFTKDSSQKETPHERRKRKKGRE